MSDHTQESFCSRSLLPGLYFMQAYFNDCRRTSDAESVAKIIVTIENREGV